METQATITQWVDATFGPVSSNIRVAARANEEMAELLRALTTNHIHPKTAEEIADVVIVLCRLADRLGGVLPRSGMVPSVEVRSTRCAMWANEAMANLLMLLETDPNHADAMRMILECVHNLRFLAVLLGVDLWDEVEKKMKTNRERVWNIDGSGHGYHVRKKE